MQYVNPNDPSKGMVTKCYACKKSFVFHDLSKLIYHDGHGYCSKECEARHLKSYTVSVIGVFQPPHTGPFTSFNDAAQNVVAALRESVMDSVRCHVENVETGDSLEIMIPAHRDPVKDLLKIDFENRYGKIVKEE